MPAYCLFRCLSEHDPEKFALYRAAVRPTLAPFGARMLAVSPQFDQVEGRQPTKSLALVEFASMAAARSWYHSPEYQAIVRLRTDSGDYEAFIFDGLPATTRNAP